jgi:hypothetical protein
VGPARALRGRLANVRIVAGNRRAAKLLAPPLTASDVFVVLLEGSASATGGGRRGGSETSLLPALAAPGGSAVAVAWVARTGREADSTSNKTTTVSFELPAAGLGPRCYCVLDYLGQRQGRPQLALCADDANLLVLNVTSYPQYLYAAQGTGVPSTGH